MARVSRCGTRSAPSIRGHRVDRDSEICRIDRVAGLVPSCPRHHAGGTPPRSGSFVGTAQRRSNGSGQRMLQFFSLVPARVHRPGARGLRTGPPCPSAWRREFRAAACRRPAGRSLFEAMTMSCCLGTPARVRPHSASARPVQTASTGWPPADRSSIRQWLLGSIPAAGSGRAAGTAGPRASRSRSR